MRWSIVMATLVASLAGCADRLAHVRTSASTSLLCQEDGITLRRRRPRVYEATGCGRTGILQCRETGHPRCVDLATMARERVANERRCPVEQVRAEEVAPFVFMTQGCGARETYHCERIGDEARCLLESREEERTEPVDEAPEVQLL